MHTASNDMRADSLRHALIPAAALVATLTLSATSSAALALDRSGQPMQGREHRDDPRTDLSALSG